MVSGLDRNHHQFGEAEGYSALANNAGSGDNQNSLKPVSLAVHRRVRQVLESLMPIDKYQLARHSPDIL